MPNLTCPGCVGMRPTTTRRCSRIMRKACPMSKVRVVSMYVPLRVKHLTRDQYHKFGARLTEACGGRLTVYTQPLDECWAYQFRHCLPATETPADRYETPQDHVNSHIVQHNR